MNTFTHVPPGFRFHPTDEELVDYYLRRKITSTGIELDVIKDVDLYRIEPWDLQELCRIETEERNEWYFFSHKDKKYPTGTRTNRATTAGFWKATGRDKAIYSKRELIGMRKTLVFYRGRAPNGQKSDWIMHEYRLETDENGTPQEEGWVVCRVFKKKISTVQKINEHDSPIWFNDDQVSYMPEMDSPKQHNSHSNLMHYNYPYNNNNDNNTSCKKEILMDLQCGIIPPDHHHHQFLQLPLLESPKMPSFESGLINVNNLQSLGLTQENTIHQTLDQNFHSVFRNEEQCNNNDQVTDWRVLDKFVASQLSHEEMSKENNEDCNLIAGNYSNKQDRMAQENASTCQIDLWK